MIVMKKDLSNQQFGRLTAKEIVGKDKRGYLWRCECECGGEKKYLQHICAMGTREAAAA